MRKKNFSDPTKNEIIKKYLEGALSKFGEMHYCYAIMNKRDTDCMTIITNLPDYFTEVYLLNSYQSVDPIIINALNRVTPLVWDSSLLINGRWPVGKIFESIKPHDVLSGQTFVLHDPNNNLVLLSLYINRFLNPKQHELALNCRNEIQGILIDAHDMVMHIYADEPVPPKNNDFILSARENEILYWYCAGKNYAEIARKLNLTVSTIKFHMSKIVKKLGVKNAKHAIVLAIELDLVHRP